MSLESASSPPVGLLLSDDMMFTSRITGTAHVLGLTVQPARSAAALIDLARRHTPRCLIIDLANPGLIIADLLRQMQTFCAPMPKVVAYGSHVDTATLQQAREAGCDLVWPRSKFVEELPRALPEWLGPVGERGQDL